MWMYASHWGRNLLALLSITSTTLADPIVIYDSGRTTPLAPYRESITVKPGVASRASEIKAPFVGLQRLFPIHTPEMTPGRLVSIQPRVELYQHLRHLPRPLFLIGADVFSQQWLIQHADQLRKLDAVGLLIEAESFEAFKAMKAMAMGLVIVPVSASSLAKVLGLTHYPVLISPAGIEQ